MVVGLRNFVHSVGEGENEKGKLRVRKCFSVRDLEIKENISKKGRFVHIVVFPESYKLSNIFQIAITDDAVFKKHEQDFNIKVQTTRIQLNQAIILFL